MGPDGSKFKLYTSALTRCAVFPVVGSPSIFSLSEEREIFATLEPMHMGRKVQHNFHWGSSPNRSKTLQCNTGTGPVGELSNFFTLA
jgi:hypothetical protein